MSGNGGGTSAQPIGRSGDNRPLTWLLRQKIAVPDRVAGHVERAALVDWIMPTRLRLTVLKAPRGLGKTTRLGECCRCERASRSTSTLGGRGSTVFIAHLRGELMSKGNIANFPRSVRTFSNSA